MYRNYLIKNVYSYSMYRNYLIEIALCTLPCINWLVVCFFFSISWNNHPNWRNHIFQRGGEKPPTSKWFSHQSLHLLRQDLQGKMSGHFEASRMLRVKRQSLLETKKSKWHYRNNMDNDDSFSHRSVVISWVHIFHEYLRSNNGIV